MIQELVNTSVSAGLEPGSEGFCTVACTQSMAPNIRAQLELMGGYRPIWKLGDPQVEQNPVLLSHYRLLIGGCFYNVLSRIATCGADHQGRLNRIAHHIILETYDQQPQGPAEILLDDEIIFKTWDGPAKHLPMGRIRLTAKQVRPMVCKTWEKLTGDAGWAGEIVQAAVNDPTQPSYIIYKPCMDTAALLREAMSIVPVSRRWDITFSTHFDILPTKTDFCTWRFCIAGSKAAALAEKNAINSIVIDLTKPVKPAGDHHYPRVARTGDDDPEAPEDISFSHPTVEPPANNVPHPNSLPSIAAKSVRNFKSPHVKKQPKNSSPVRTLLSLAALAIIILQAVVITDLLRNNKKSQPAEPASTQSTTTPAKSEKVQAGIHALTADNAKLQQQLNAAKKMQQSQKILIEQLQRQNKDLWTQLTNTKKTSNRFTRWSEANKPVAQPTKPTPTKPSAPIKKMPNMLAKPSANAYRQLPSLVPDEQHKSVTNEYSLRLRGPAEYARLVLPCDLPDDMKQNGNAIEIQSITSLGNTQTQKIIELANSPKGLELKSFPVEYNENNKLLPKLRELETLLKYSAVKVGAITYQFVKKKDKSVDLGSNTEVPAIPFFIPKTIKHQGRKLHVSQIKNNSWQLTIEYGIKIAAHTTIHKTGQTYFSIALADDCTPKAIDRQLKKFMGHDAEISAKLETKLSELGFDKDEINLKDSLHKAERIVVDKYNNTTDTDAKKQLRNAQKSINKIQSIRHNIEVLKGRQHWLSEDHSFDIEMTATRSGAMLYKIKVNYKK